MKKYLLIIPLIALALSCGPKGNSYQIKGTVTDSLGTDPTAKVVLVHYNGVMEEAPVVEGKFSFTGEAAYTYADYNTPVGNLRLSFSMVYAF